MFSHCLWNKCQSPCHVSACPLATSANLAHDSPATLPSFVPSICQTLSCPRTFAGVLLSAGNTLYSIQLLHLLHSMYMSMYVYIYSLMREQTGPLGIGGNCINLIKPVSEHNESLVEDSAVLLVATSHRQTCFCAVSKMVASLMCLFLS